MSKFLSTRNKADAVDARNAIVRGLSADGGLYAPDVIPEIDYHKLMGLPYYKLAAEIIKAFFTDFPEGDIECSCEEAYNHHFDTAEVCPVVKKGGIYITELFHGETCAFKDVALSILPRLMVRALRSLAITDKVLILTATSGDTGSAAMNGFRDVPGTGIITFFPNEGVSPLQRKQMVCMKGKNLTACAVNGNFDDCQSAVKEAFGAMERPAGVRFSSANSINIARLVPQIGYYFATYLKLVESSEIKDGEKLNFVVPTGNFGDILAGYYAKRMGLPVGKLICASNANNVLTDFLTTGVYNRNREFLKTSSPSMDILISSNLERLLYHEQEEDDKKVAFQMSALKKDGVYKIDESVLMKIRKTFDAYCCDDNECMDTIRDFFTETGYVLDPHTAVAVACEKKFEKENPGAKCAVLSTASPYKFPASILRALNMNEEKDAFMMLDLVREKTGTAIPEALGMLESATELHTDVIEKSGIQEYVYKTCGKLF